MTSEYRFWIRERGRARNKWHVSESNEQQYTNDGETISQWDHTPCGKDYYAIESKHYETRELPNGTLPTDAHGVCRHCMRWTETENRKAEATSTQWIDEAIQRTGAQAAR